MIKEPFSEVPGADYGLTRSVGVSINIETFDGVEVTASGTVKLDCTPCKSVGSIVDTGDISPVVAIPGRGRIPG